jgi:hypothetical protein
MGALQLFLIPLDQIGSRLCLIIINNIAEYHSMGYSLRLEKPIKEICENLSVKSGVSISDIIEHIALIGLEVRRLGGINIAGLFGFDLPFVGVDWGPLNYRLTVQVNPELKSRLKEEFSDNISAGLRKMIRSGLLLIDASSALIINEPTGLLLPLTSIGDFKLEDERAINALHLIRRILE